MTDRRRLNGPSADTAPPIYAASNLQRPVRTRKPKELRKIFLQTGLTPTASGSAYLELEPSNPVPPLSQRTSLIPQSSSLKLTCTVHGPRPLPRSAPFSPQLLLSTHVKFAPFAARKRRGFVRDAGERDLTAHLEAALKGVILGERWPKSGVDVIVTVLEGEEDRWWGESSGVANSNEGFGGLGMMTVLSGCITVASAAIVEAGIDCVDFASGGVAAKVRMPRTMSKSRGESENGAEDPDAMIVLDPCPSEHDEILAACVVGYLASRDELTELWARGEMGDPSEIIDAAVEAAVAARGVQAEVARESVELRLPKTSSVTDDAVTPKKLGETSSKEVEMTG